MRLFPAFSLSLVLALGCAQAENTAVYSNLTGVHFAFKNMTEVGGTNVPPGLEQPRLFPSPHDSIKFSPSTYVVVENNGPSLERSTSSSVLNLTLDSVAGAHIQELIISVSGTYGMNLYQSAPAGQANVGLSLGLDLTYGSSTVSDFLVNVTQNSTEKTWFGIRTFTATELSSIFQQPTLQVQQLVIAAKPSVYAEAQWANATSQINYLDFTVVPIPEPASLPLLWAGFGTLMAHRCFRKKA